MTPNFTSLNQDQSISNIGKSPINVDDDLSSNYQAYKIDQEKDEAFSEMMKAVEPLSTEKNQPTKNEIKFNNQPMTSSSGSFKTTGKAILGGAGSVAKDIGLGARESGRAIAGGVRDAAQETYDLTQAAGDWAEKHLKMGGIKIDSSGFDYLSNEDFAAQQASGDLTPITLPKIREPESVTGKLIKGVSQFLTGFIGAGKIKAVANLAPKIGATGTAAVKGAISDFTVFDGHQERLSNLIQEQPLLANPVNEFLASSPEDSEAEGRFKNAVEGLGLGVITEGFIRGVKVLRAANKAKLEAKGVPLEAPLPAVSKDAFKVLGDASPDAPLIRSQIDAVNLDVKTPDNVDFGRADFGDIGAPLDLAAKGISQSVNPEIAINFARIDTEDDVKNVIQQMADAYKPDIDQARRGKQTFEDIKLNAEEQNSWDILNNRREGDPLNAEQSLAVRNLWAASGKRLASAAELAASTPSEENLFAFRKMMAIHEAIQMQVIAARTETARALASWRIPANTNGAEQYRAISDALESVGGNDLTRDMAGRLNALYKKGMIPEAEAFANKGAYAKTRDAFLEVWINALLSGPKTHLVNLVSAACVVFQQMYERAAAARIAQLIGDDNSVQLGEATAQYSGMINGLKDAFRFAYQSFKTGETGYGVGKVELGRESSVSSRAFNIAQDSMLGKTVDVLGHSVVNLPTRALSATDEFFKSIGYRMELNALALRQAAQEVHSGKIKPEDLKSRIADIVSNPPSNIKLAAIDQATYQTFNSAPGDISKSLIRLKGKYPALNIIIPFVRTVGNIMKYSFERTPLSPLMSQTRADLMAGGARRDLATAKMATGTAIMLMTADMAMNGQITGKGPSSPEERKALQRNGWQPYSVKAGDRYFAYNRLDPLGMTMGMAADMVDILSNDEFGIEKEKTAQQAITAITLSIANNVMSKTYMSGVSGIMQAMSDPERYGDSYFNRLGGTFIPTGVSDIAKMNDPYMREANNMVETIMSRTPGLSDNLPKRRDLWGRPISYKSGLGGLYDAMSPVYSKKIKEEPIDKEILRLEAGIEDAGRVTSFDGVKVDLEKYPGVYSRYVQLAGNELKDPAFDLGAKDFLNEVVSGNSILSPVYEAKTDGPDGTKQEYIKEVIYKYRSMARSRLLEEYPDLAEEIRQRKEKKLGLNFTD